MSQPNGKRTTKAEVERRTTEVYKMLIAGVPRHEITRLGNEKFGWDVSKTAIDRYIAKATERLKQDAKHHREAELGKALARLDVLFRRTMDAKRWRDALAVEQTRIALLGLDESRSDDMTAVDEFLAAMKGGKS